MNNVIKAIETEYDGHRFRNRIEARWAVFFNATLTLDCNPYTDVPHIVRKLITKKE